MPSYTLSHQAYVKIYLHAAKYPHKTVNGVLIGKKGKSREDSVAVLDAIPLLHLWTTLSPMMEIGLELAKTHAESRELLVVGYYQASERLYDNVLPPTGEKVVGKIREWFKDAIALVLDGNKIGSGEAGLIPYLYNGVTWRPDVSAFSPSSNISLENPRSPSRALDLIRNHKLHQQFNDFDDHLENVSADWLSNAACFDENPTA
ncbi:hypothetical protein Clacol_008551 [Clathrus columnatus]|uniref:MPN domain-containing protein n=1 Tax=Clathrus columnatus TaxID=1419009 RepID=A0AAV5AKL6_9AGAM|nr:hypothetical protein Clacol_008551 [Clathrus columnatus]